MASINSNGLSCIDRLKLGFKTYFEFVLTIPEHYKAVMISQDSHILERTANLNPKTISRLPAQKKLVETLSEGIKNKEIKDVDPITTAQVIWSSMFGLLIRIITERVTDKEMIERLINHYFELIFNGLKQ